MPVTVVVHLPDGVVAEADSEEPVASVLRRILAAQTARPRREPSEEDIAAARAWAARQTLVAAPEGMPLQVFAIHMNKRHADSLGGLRGLPAHDRWATPPLAAAWQAFHRRLHNLRTDLDHIHESPW